MNRRKLQKTHLAPLLILHIKFQPFSSILGTEELHVSQKKHKQKPTKKLHFTFSELKSGATGLKIWNLTNIRNTYILAQF